MSPALPLSQPRTLVFLAYPQMGLLDLTGGLTPALPAPASPLLAAPVTPERPPKLFRRAFFCCTRP